MTNSNLTESQHKNLARNQELLTACFRDRINTLGPRSCYGITNPVTHPAALPVFAIDTTLLKFARENYDEDPYKLKKVLFNHMGPLQGGPVFINGEKLGWDVQYSTAEELAFLVWHEQIHSQGYRLLTEKAAAKLFGSKTNILLRSWRESYYSDDYKRSRKIRHAVRLTCPQLQNVDGYDHTSYCLDATYSNKKYKFSILAASHYDTTMQGLWFYKPSSWQKA